jgi:peptidoglycan/xylan/chitin deacetylase (PgdA/CDA1 family)
LTERPRNRILRGFVPLLSPFRRLRIRVPLPITVLLVLGLAACGGKGDEDSRPESTPAGAATSLAPPKTVVLTFDDATRSHLEIVAPLLKEFGFGATFFVTAYWMSDRERYLSWSEVAELHRMGFEIGNHSFTHYGFGTPGGAELLPDELMKVEDALARVGIPKPVSFAYPGDEFGPEARQVLSGRGYLFARRGGRPEFPGRTVGRPWSPRSQDPLLIPSTAVAGPHWDEGTLDTILAQAKSDRPVILQIHGVPDPTNDRVSFGRMQFTRVMRRLKAEGCRVIAMRDLAPLVDPKAHLRDPMSRVRWPVRAD